MNASGTQREPTQQVEAKRWIAKRDTDQREHLRAKTIGYADFGVNGGTNGQLDQALVLQVNSWRYKNNKLVFLFFFKKKLFTKQQQ